MYPSVACNFEHMDAVSHSGIDGKVETSLFEKVSNTETGSWYLYDDKQESDEKIARIKLIINRAPSARLVFTNQNRRKVLTMTYMEFAARISSGTIRSLDPSLSLSDFMTRHLGIVVDTVKAQKARELKEKEAVERKLISKQFLSH